MLSIYTSFSQRAAYPTSKHHRSLSFFPNPSTGHDPTSFFNVLGSGAMARLHTLEISQGFSPNTVVLGDAKLLPNSLPSLRTLNIDAPMSADFLGGILGAAGPGLTIIRIEYGQTVPIAMRLLEENDYVWASALQSLTLRWKQYGGDGDLDTPLHAIDALACLSSRLS